MIGLENKDTSFFYLTLSSKLKVPGVLQIAPQDLIEKSIMSLSITEEMGKIDHGTLTIVDDQNVWSQIFRTGAAFKIVWGYKQDPTQRLKGLVSSVITNPAVQAFGGGRMLRLLDGIVMSPSGNGDQSGRIVYNITFYGSTFTRTTVTKVWDAGTKGDMVRSVLMEQMGIPAKNILVDWPAFNDALTKTFGKKQKDTPHKFLWNFSQEEKCFFRVGYGPDGQKNALFIGNSQLDSESVVSFNKRITGADVGSKLVLGFREKTPGVNQVQSFNWSQNIGENGTGDSGQLMYINGQPIIIRSVAGQQQTTGYKYKPEAVKNALKRDMSFSNFMRIAFTDNFDQLVQKGFFEPVVLTTAPEGFGFKCSCSLPVGDPRITTPCVVNFSTGFPKPLQDTGNTFYVQSVTHEIDSNGYRQSVEVADTFTITGGSLIGAVGAGPKG